ncbi:LysR family transcriptional regulator [Bacillus massiliigorillae]|uniref:LysR family transcriptional regulator n=1 Tax=Bacillus massiliigorillae TaxID=1243664 RepID=UPI00039ED487|nr:LysR family transcriptional regulator [Bacillus massiliigorillae]
MDLKTIKTFKTIVRLGSFQRAAEELNYAQSTVTMHIKSLESELGVLLLERGKKLQLTEAGRLLNEKGDLLLKGFENLQSSMEDLVHGESGQIRLGVMEPAASFRIPLILSSFIEKFPKVQLSIHIQSSKVLSEMVKKDEVDLALCTAPEMNQSLIFDPIFSEEVVLLMPTYHRLANNERIALRDLEGEQLITTNSYCPFRRNLEQQMIEVGINPEYGLEVSNMLALKHYVQCNFGIAIVPLIAVSPPPVGTVIKKIEDFNSELKVGFMKNTERSYSGRAIEHLIEVINNRLKLDECISI